MLLWFLAIKYCQVLNNFEYNTFAVGVLASRERSCIRGFIPRIPFCLLCLLRATTFDCLYFSIYNNIWWPEILLWLFICLVCKFVKVCWIKKELYFGKNNQDSWSFMTNSYTPCIILYSPRPKCQTFLIVCLSA